MANNTPKNSQETKDQNQRTVSEKLQLAVAATLALMMADLSSPTQLQQQYADRGAEISQSMKEIGLKAVDKMLVGLEKVVDAIGPTPAYAGGNPDELRRKKAEAELDDMLEEENKKGEVLDKKIEKTREGIRKADERNKELDKEIKQIQEKRMHIDKVEGSKNFISAVFKGNILLNKESKKQWLKYRKDMLENMFVYEQDIQQGFRQQVERMDSLMQSVR